jgi:hypothetical protein
MTRASPEPRQRTLPARSQPDQQNLLKRWGAEKHRQREPAAELVTLRPDLPDV